MPSTGRSRVLRVLHPAERTGQGMVGEVSRHASRYRAAGAVAEAAYLFVVIVACALALFCPPVGEDDVALLCCAEEAAAGAIAARRQRQASEADSAEGQLPDAVDALKLDLEQGQPRGGFLVFRILLSVAVDLLHALRPRQERELAVHDSFVARIPDEEVAVASHSDELMAHARRQVLLVN